MKNTIVFALLAISFYGFQKENVNRIFFGVPLQQSRDSIYFFCIKAPFLTKLQSGSVSRHGRPVKTYYGFINDQRLTDKDTDSIYLQLSTGSKYSKGKVVNTELLVFYKTYIITGKKKAYAKFDAVEASLDSITAEKLVSVLVDKIGKTVGKRAQYNLKEKDTEITLDLEQIEGSKYSLQLQYNRPELYE